MPSQYVCPNCGGTKIGKEEGEKEYYCDACCSFFEEPKLITTNSEREERIMGNRYKSDLDIDKIKVLAADKTVPEIAAETGYKIPSIRSVLLRAGIKAKVSRTRKARKSSNKVAKPAIKADRPDDVRVNSLTDKCLKDITLLDCAITERNQCQERVFVLNKVIELLSV